MARRKKSTNKKIKENNLESVNEIKGIIMITTGILIIFSVFSRLFNSTTSSGFFGDFIRKLLIAVLGLGSYIFPFIIIFVGFCLIVKKGKVNFNAKFYGINLFLINTLLFIQMVKLKDFYSEGKFKLGFEKFWHVKSIVHGGILGYIIDVPLYKLFSNVGCYIIFSAIYIISLLLIFRISLYDIFASLKEVLKRERKISSVEFGDNDIETDDEALIVCDNNKESFIKNINSKIKIIDFVKKINIDNDDSEDEKIDYYKEKNEKIKLDYENVIIQEDNTDKENEINSFDDKKTTKEKIEEEIKINSLVMKEKPIYTFPTIDLLEENNEHKSKKSDKRELLNSATKLQDTLNSFGVKAKVIQVTKGPSVTRFELQPDPGVKVSKIVNLADDIALNLASSGIRIEAPIPGKAAVGIEVPNKEQLPVCLREVIESTEFSSSKNNLAFCLGKDIAGNCVVGDLSKMPHVLVAGATGSGKSVCINSLIISLLFKYSPENVKLLLIDPKVVELNIYNGIPHLLIPVVTDTKKAASALNWAVNEMTRRYKAFADNGVRNIEGYNYLVEQGKISEKMPWIVIIIDELADLMMVAPKDVEDYIARLAQMARAAGMHLVIATQRPSVDVITGMIKANIPSRISFAVSSQIDSRTILDSSGAEKLLGKGDMLFYPVGAPKPIRIQGAFISEAEVERVVEFIKVHVENIEYETDIINEIDNNLNADNSKKNETDSLLSEAIEFVIKSNYASTSMLQRKFKIGYNRAARLMDEMEDRGIISARNGSKPRQVLVTKEQI
ncbi:DNA translocase SpoIIIE [Clostridium tepidiprofundi DSM 19306]|uniref:DNA translocase SpoIIIE n=1 Tax=Clostridium tepidiprofundi DSM 19306 TaxID=1121338 RepID=A0A151B765_9CLOT|nr:DNA translocase FtsK [Clostridium tepidiprofundi]KYH35781.1 DNA translocase SpoIIIE [Clostridium tepidiprofundi DSM 19306]